MIVNDNIPCRQRHCGLYNYRNWDTIVVHAFWTRVYSSKRAFTNAACGDTILVKAKNDREFAAEIFDKYRKSSYSNCKRISKARMRAVCSVQVPHV